MLNGIAFAVKELFCFIKPMLLINKSIGFGDKFLWFCLEKHAYFSWILYVRHYLELHY